MMKTQNYFRKSRERLKIYLPSLIITCLGFIIAYQFVKPAPPKTITIATGNPQGAYYAFGQTYREILSQYGITLNVVSTKGSVENLDLLRQVEKGVDIAFVQGGVGDPAAMPELRSLASVYYEPLWIFQHTKTPSNRLMDLKGKRIVVGQEGSGTRSLALLLLNENGIFENNTSILDWGSQKAEASLKSGDVDVAFFVASPKSQVVRRLLETEEHSLLSIERGKAYPS